MEEDDDILESSLFYSCMSEEGGGDAGDGVGARCDANEKSSEESKAVDPEPSSERADKMNDAVPSPSTLRNDATTNAEVHEDANDIPSNPSSSNSSWSVLSEKERPKVRSITFNRDRSCLLLSTSRGVRVRTLESLHLSLHNLNVDDENHSQSSWIHDVPLKPDGATYAQLLHTTSLLAVVKPSSPRCCYLYNAKNSSSPLAALPLSAAVKRVELQRRVLAAMTVDLRLHVFHMTDDSGDIQHDKTSKASAERKSLRPILITTLNIMHPSDSPRNVTRGIDAFNTGSYFDLSTHEDEPYLICKSFSGSMGTVRVYDPTKVQAVPNVASGNASVGSGSAVSTSSWDKHNIPLTRKIKHRIQLITAIKAHDHPVTRMVIGGGGEKQQTFLATASTQGTTIRVFKLPSGEHLWEWHRGSRACQIYSLSWNGTADRLAAIGSSGTLHIFDWQKTKQPTESVIDDNADDDGKDFQRVHDDAGPRNLDKPESPSKPLLRRIGSSIKRRASSNSAAPIKYRSFAKLKYKPSTLPNNSASASANAARTQPLVLALLDRSNDKNDQAEMDEDNLVVCTMNGELRRYNVQESIVLTQIEDVLARR